MPAAAVCVVVVAAVAQQERWPAGWAYDGGKSIFSLAKFLPQHENVTEVGPFVILMHSLGMGCRQEAFDFLSSSPWHFEQG